MTPRPSRSFAAPAAIAAGAVAGAVASTFAGAWYQLMRRPLPRTKGSATVAGVDRPVEIRRDRWGVPFISAESKHDLWFGQGYCHGQDRLWQLELYRRTAAGRISEIAGRTTLPTDRLMRTIGFRRIAEREEAELEPELRAELDALCAGVNAAAVARPLPFEFQVLRLEFDPWTPADMLAATKLLAFGLSTNWERELLRAEMARELGPRARRPARPGLSHRPPAGDAAGRRLRRAGPRDRGADRPDPGDARPLRRGERFEQLGRQRRALGVGRADAGRRPAPAPEHARHLVPGRARTG
jgi:acyl-homoserine lactone acylase PvdQ